MNLSRREYIFFAVGLLVAVCFFVAYPSQDPRNIIDLSKDRAAIKEQAITQFKSLGYSEDQYRIQTSFNTNRKLLDSLQIEMGRQQMIKYFRANKVSNMELYYWEVQFHKTSEEGNFHLGSGPEDEQEDSGNEVIKMRFDPAGHFLELVNSSDILPLQVVNRPAIAATFSTDQDSVLSLLSQYTDSALTQRILVDVRRSSEKVSLDDGKTFQQLRNLLQEQKAFLLSDSDVYAMASFYLKETPWDLSELEKDTVQLGRINGINTTSAQFKLPQPKLGQDLLLDIKMTSTGALMNISSTYNPGGNGGTTFEELAPLLSNAIILLFCLAGVIIFFFRIRARAIDTKPALVVAILAGIAVSSFIVLGAIHKANLFAGDVNWTVTIAILVGAGLGGAGASLGTFVLFSIGDSITRQHWSPKLNMYDYLRQGMIFNKPIGSVLMRSVILAFMLSAIWTFLLWLLPGFYIEVRDVFVHDAAAWPPLYLLVSNGWLSLIIIVGLFLVLGGQAYAMTKNKITTSALMVLACVIVVPVTGNFGPFWLESIAGAVLGIALTLIYLEWDFMTLLLSHFLFLGLVETSAGWIVDGSMDTYIFIIFMGLLAFLFVMGFLAMSRGKEEKVLSHYVPEYVEELAQEERIKQELQIAREVQQSFLPVRTPEFARLELAAICKPAYETGGDYYDFIPLNENRVAVTIGDVSGKGIQAAFYMTFIKGILHTLCRESDSPAEVLKKTNRLFCDNAPRGIFISLVYGIIDLEKREFHFARAGHNPILRINSKVGSVEELQPKGLGIGLTKSESFDQNIEEVTLQLSEDDVLVLYTDGIVEALNENHTFYGTHRLNNTLQQNKEQSAEELLEKLSQDVRAYIGDAKQHDDMTMMIMKLKKD